MSIVSSLLNILATTVGWCQFNFSARLKVCYENVYLKCFCSLDTQLSLPLLLSPLPLPLPLPTSALLFRSLIICTPVAHATGCECSQRRLSAAISKANPIPIWQTCHTTPRRAASHDLIFKIEKSASAKPKGRSIKLGFNTRQGGHTARQRERGRERAGCMGRLDESSILLGCESN